MAKTRIHEIAKEQGLSNKDVLDTLQAAGLDVTAPASTVGEGDALRALGGGNGAASARSKAAAAAAPRAGAGETVPRGAPVRPGGNAPQGRGAPVRPPEGRG